MYRGVSDSGLAFQLPRVIDELAPRTLIVDRDPGDVLASFRRFWGKPFDEQAVEMLLADAHGALSRFFAHPLVRVVKFEALNDYDTAQECYRWLMPGNPHPLRRDLFNMRVNVSRESAEVQSHTLWHMQGA